MRAATDPRQELNGSTAGQRRGKFGTLSRRAVEASGKVKRLTPRPCLPGSLAPEGSSSPSRARRDRSRTPLPSLPGFSAGWKTRSLDAADVQRDAFRAVILAVVRVLPLALVAISVNVADAFALRRRPRCATLGSLTVSTVALPAFTDRFAGPSRNVLVRRFPCLR